MELRDFIKETMISIIVGVKETQSYIRTEQLDCEICPKIKTNYEKTGFIFSESGKPIREIEFDILVSVTKKTGKKGAFGITISTVKLGNEKNAEQVHGQNSRLQFSLPVTLPSM
jgi:hypothetical protein